MEGDARRKYIHRHDNLPHQTFYDMCGDIDVLHSQLQAAEAREHKLRRELKEMTEERDELMGHIKSLRGSL